MDTVNQWDAARRQLTTAIWMYFNGGDAVSIHTLVGAAREIYEKHCARTGVERMFEHIKATNEGTETQLWNIINGARNFFKHPKLSLDERIHFTDAYNKAALFLACHDCSMLLGANQPIEVQVFNVWFMATEFPSDASDVDRDAAMDRIRSIDALFPGLRTAGPEEQLARGRRLLADAIAVNPNMASSRLPDRLGKSEALINWLDRQIDGLAIAANDRHRMAAGCLDAAMEYHKAFVVLIAVNSPGN